MAKFYGNVGFAVSRETTPGVWKDDIVEYPYYGDVLQDHMRPKSTDKVIDNIVISDEISIISDPFARSNCHSIRYVWYMGTKWKITSVDVRYPRLNLTLGDAYNG